MRWLITGAAGQVGNSLAALLGRDGEDVLALKRADFDITERQAVHDVLRATDPDVVINTAAWTDVDAAEADEDGAWRINADAPSLLADALRPLHGRLIHISTDFVFDGTAQEPYDVDNEPNPLNAYGRSKLAGEREILSVLPDRSHVVRTAWVFGGPSPNFVDTIVRLEGERETLDVVSDQIGSPTWAFDLAAGLVALGRAATAPQILHYVNAGAASRLILARAVFEQLGADPERIQPIESTQSARAAARPAWSVLSTKSWIVAGLPAPRDWQLALRGYLHRADRS